MNSNDQQVIVLMTDFGLNDPWVGQMKGVILSLCPSARIVDLTHAIEPQNIVHGAFMLGKSCRYFPEKTIFVSVVDPGVGTSRRPIALETSRHIFIGPDNGLFTPVLEQEEIMCCMHITENRFMLPKQSSTFQGRDLFSPVAAHLTSGISLKETGVEIDPCDCIRIDMPACKSPDNGRSWEGSIIYADHFGNLITSLDSDLIGNPEQWLVIADNVDPLPISVTYCCVENKKPLAYAGSSGMIEIAVRNGNAAGSLNLANGDKVRLARK
ncbi:MAG: SAM-dependent chlorinase/fluorinase [Chlorobiaceae bacterium]|nr:SAM-dependent chlorinase/fluorinase [Chlorobiaceae bacterium]